MADKPQCSLQDLLQATQVVASSDHVVRTPVIKHAQQLFNMQGLQLHLKMENMQNLGSFKIRAAVMQMHQWAAKLSPPPAGGLITCSAGNYGKAVAYLSSCLQIPCTVLMPTTAPHSRVEALQACGAKSERLTTEDMLSTYKLHIEEHGMTGLHSSDDIKAITGVSGIGFEILEDVGVPDIVLVCCGGGACLAGVAAAIKLSGHEQCRVYGVEPHGARAMFESLKAGRVMSMDSESVATGLNPPRAGTEAYKFCREFVEGILLVSDEEILTAMFALYDRGILAEPSGSAAFAALYHGKVKNVEGKNVVVVLTGANVTATELAQLSARMGRQ